MKIGVFTEGGYKGKVLRDNPNMRTDLAWWCALEATHHPIPVLHQLSDNLYDFGIVIIPTSYMLSFILDRCSIGWWVASRVCIQAMSFLIFG